MKIRTLAKGAAYAAGSLLLVLAIFLGLIWYFDFPAVDVNGGSVSPDGKWVAVTETLQYGPLAVGNEYAAVELRPFNHPLGFFEGHRVFQTDVGPYEHANLIGVEWTADHVLKIKVRAGSAGGDDFRLPWFLEIKIDYESVATP
jgi:hypothetical protein